MTNWEAWIKCELWFAVRFLCYLLFISVVAGFFGLDPFDMIAVVALSAAMRLKSGLEGKTDD